MEPEGLLLCSDEPATGPYLDHDESCPQLPTLFLYGNCKFSPVLNQVPHHEAVSCA
jgi:hypothetical protein